MLVRYQFRISFLIIALSFILSPIVSAQEALPKARIISSNQHAKWERIFGSLFLGKLRLNNASSLIESELYLLRFNPRDFKIKVAIADSDQKIGISDLKSLVEKEHAIAGINANFFDTNRKPLGLVKSEDFEYSNNIQMGGNLLTGIFYIKDNEPKIVHRSKFEDNKNISLAIQAGPRIIVNSKQVTLSSNDSYSRRSGIAITNEGDIVLFATALRFPGATFEDIQNGLHKSGLNILDALNLDGGGSSQLYFKSPKDGKEIHVSGGDAVPVALIVKKANQS